MFAAGRPLPHLLLRYEVYEAAVPLCTGPRMQLQGCQLFHVPLKALQDLLLGSRFCLIPAAQPELSSF